MVGWHHRLNDRKFEHTLGAGEGQGRPVCCFHRVAKSQLFVSGGQSIGASASASVLPMNIQG